jgi:hypothetical protein
MSKLTKEVHNSKGKFIAESRTEPSVRVESTEGFYGGDTRGRWLDTLVEEFTAKSKDPLRFSHNLADKQHRLRLLFDVEYVTSEIDKCYYPNSDHHDLAKSSLQNTL